MRPDYRDHLVLQVDPFLLEILQPGIASRLDLLFDPADFPVHQMISVEQLREVVVRYLQFMNRVGVLGQVMPQIVVFSVHLNSLFLGEDRHKHNGSQGAGLDVAQGAAVHKEKGRYGALGKENAEPALFRG